MGLKVVIFLGPPRGFGRQRQALRFQFGNYVSKPTRLLGVALFRWLCAERGLPEQVIVLGEPSADWDMLHELAAVPYHMPQFQRLQLREKLNAGPLAPEDLRALSGFLQDFLGGIDVRCVTFPRQPGRTGQLRFFTALDEHVGSGDELHVDVAQDIWACGLFGTASSAFLTRASRVDIGGLYVADPASTSMAGTPVLIISQVNRLIAWADSIAVFRQSGLLGKLPDLFGDEAPELADALNAVNFAVLTHQYDDLYENFQRCVTHLRALARPEPRTLTQFFARQFLREASWIEDSHLADWQIEFARRALASGDYLRAASLTQESVVSAAIRRTRMRTDPAYRHHVREYLLAERNHAHLYPVDPWPFIKLWDLRAILAGTQPADPETRRDILRNDQKLHHFLERAISFAAVLVARFKRVPPM